MKDSVDIKLSGEKIVPNYISLAVGLFLTVVAIVVGAFSVWAGAAIGLLGLIVSAFYPPTATLYETVKIHTAD